MSSQRARSLRLPALVVAMGLLLGACMGDTPRSGVNVKSLATDLVYGIPPSPVPAPPANQNPTSDEPQAVQVIDEPRAETRDDFEPEPIEPIEGTSCPEAAPDEFPAPLSSVLEGKPSVGEYRWMIDGTQVLAAIGRVSLPKETVRQITEVEDIQGGFSYTTFEPEVTAGSRDEVRTTYEVLPEGTATRDAGVYLTRIIREREDGSVKSRFEPSPGVQMLAFPVEFGQDIDSVGIDPVNFTALRVQGEVVERRRVDACGELVDGWFVNGVQEFVDASGDESRRNYDYAIAPQLGATLVFEHVETPCVGGGTEGEESSCSNDPDVVFDARIGQLEPSPIED